MSKIEINGMAHVILTVTRFSKAREFYKSILPKFGMTCVMDGKDFCYHVGGRTAIGIRRCDPEFESETFKQYRVGLHHLCLRAKSRADVAKENLYASNNDYEMDLLQNLLESKYGNNIPWNNN